MQMAVLAAGSFGAGLIVCFLWLLAQREPVLSIGNDPAEIEATATATGAVISIPEMPIVPIPPPIPTPTPAPESASGWVRLGKEVEYFDADTGGHFRLDYDSHDESNRSLGAYTQSKERVNLKGTERWRKARFLLDDARFVGGENDGSDFRVTVVGGRFFLRSVKVVWE